MKNVLASFLLLSTLNGVAANKTNHELSSVEIVLVDVAGKPALYIDRKLENKRPYYQTFSKYIRVLNGKDRTINVYVSDALPYGELIGISGELEAVGFLRIHKFIFNRKTRWNAEILQKFNQRLVPFQIDQSLKHAPPVLTTVH